MASLREQQSDRRRKRVIDEEPHAERGKASSRSIAEAAAEAEAFANVLGLEVGIVG